MSDCFSRFRILAIVDDFTREALALIPDRSLSGVRVARELDALLAGRVRLKSCVSDNVLRQEVWHWERQQISLRRR